MKVIKHWFWKLLLVIFTVWIFNCVLVLGFGKNIFGKWSVFLILPKETLECEKNGGTYFFNNEFKKFGCTDILNVFPQSNHLMNIKKPVIYLYPTKTTKVSVKVTPKLGVKFSYPEYNNGWEVTAEPNSQITTVDGEKYNYLFWEADSDQSNIYDLSTGFVVEGKNTISFLKETLKKVGLESKEYNDMITYWLPRMEENKYNLIHFATNEEYSQKNPLTISPKPDSVLRVFMVFKPLDKEVKVSSQKFEKFERKGFTVVEWGGSELN